MSPIYVPGKVTLAKDFTWNESVWNPSMLSTALWLDAADASTVTLNGSTVSQWQDKSGFSNHVSNATPATQPTYLTTAFNGLPTVSFTLAGQEVLFNGTMTNLASNQDFFIGAVFEFRQAAQAWDMICGWRSQVNTPTAGAPLLQALSTSQQIGMHNTDIADIRIKVDVTTRLTKRIATVGRTGGTAGLGGTVTVTATNPNQPSYLTTGTQTWASAATNGFQVGGKQQGGTAFGDKYISEIVCCPVNLSTNDRQKLEGYLAHKWGLTANLPSDHPYKLVGPTP
jgi:hypothetical protein